MGTEPEANDVRERFAQLYSQLRRVAEALLRKKPHSILPTELVHEAFVELQHEARRRQDAQRSELGGKPHSVFKACFGAACRDVLADRHR